MILFNEFKREYEAIRTEIDAALRRETRTHRLTRTPFGIVKEEQPKQQPEV